MDRSSWKKRAGASLGLAAVRFVTAAAGVAWLVRDWDVLPRPELALAGLIVAAVSAFFCWRPLPRFQGVEPTGSCSS